MTTKFRPFIAVLLLVGLLLGWVGHYAPFAYAQGLPNDQYACFTVATGSTGPTAATLVAASSGKRIYIKAIHCSSSSSGSLNFYDGTTLAGITTLVTAAILANSPTNIGTDFFVGGGSSTGTVPKTTAGNALGILVTGGTATGTIRYQQY